MRPTGVDIYDLPVRAFTLGSYRMVEVIEDGGSAIVSQRDMSLELGESPPSISGEIQRLESRLPIKAAVVQLGAFLIWASRRPAFDSWDPPSPEMSGRRGGKSMLSFARFDPPERLSLDPQNVFERPFNRRLIREVLQSHLERGPGDEPIHLSLIETTGRDPTSGTGVTTAVLRIRTAEISAYVVGLSGDKAGDDPFGCC